MPVKRYYLKTGIFLLGLTALYSWPALWNRWPIVFNDTASYLDTARVGTVYSYQSPGYGLFIKICLFVWHSPWAVVLCQSLIVVLSLWLLARVLILSYTRSLISIALLGILTPLPLISSIMLPDSLFLAGIICLIYLAIDPTSRHRRLALTLVILAMSVHIATGVLFLIFLVVGTKLLAKVRPQNRITKQGQLLISTIVISFAASQLALLLIFPHKPVSIWPIHLTAQLIDDNGPIIDELTDSCTTEHYSLCPYIKEISGVSSDYFLWNENQPFRQHFGQWSYTPSDWPRLIWQTAKHHPKQTATWIFQRWRQQLFIYEIGYEYGYVGWDANVTDSLKQSFGEKAVKVWQNSRQEQSWFDPMPQPWPSIYYLTGLIAHLAPVLLWLRWRHDSRRPIAFILIMIALVNALIMGTVSHPQNRYQLRIHFVPLVFLLFALGAPCEPSTPLPSGRYRSSKCP